MKCITSRFGVACLAASWLVASGAVAQSVNPASPSVPGLQAVVDKTASDSGNTQLSTINSITNLPNGIELDVTFRVGAGTGDPFDPNFGQNFARITLESSAGTPLDWSAFDGYKLTILGDINMFVQPFLKTGSGFQFYEPSGGGFGVGANSTTDVVQAFSNSRTFSPAFMDPAIVANTNDVRAYGIQVIGNGVVLGQPIDATIQITTDGIVPEPNTLMLGGLGIAAIAAAARRRR